MLFITCLPMKRINVTVREDQYERISQEGLNASGLIRGLLDDHFGEQKIVFRVSEPVQALYQQVISNFGTRRHTMPIATDFSTITCVVWPKSSNAVGMCRSPLSVSTLISAIYTGAAPRSI